MRLLALKEEHKQMLFVHSSHEMLDVLGEVNTCILFCFCLLSSVSIYIYRGLLGL
jgi:hypothetical protein